MYKAGKAKAIGVSNYCVSCFDCLIGQPGVTVVPAVNQVRTLLLLFVLLPLLVLPLLPLLLLLTLLLQIEMHVGMGDDPESLVSYCKKHKITYQAYSPLGGPDIGGKPVMDFKEVKAIAAAHGKSAAQVALRWVLQQGHALVTATVDPSYVKEDLDLWSWKLSDSEMRQLNSVRSGAPPAR